MNADLIKDINISNDYTAIINININIDNSAFIKEDLDELSIKKIDIQEDSIYKLLHEDLLEDDYFIQYLYSYYLQSSYELNELDEIHKIGLKKIVNFWNMAKRLKHHIQNNENIYIYNSVQDMKYKNLLDVKKYIYEVRNNTYDTSNFSIVSLIKIIKRNYLIIVLVLIIIILLFILFYLTHISCKKNILSESLDNRNLDKIEVKMNFKYPDFENSFLV